MRTLQAAAIINVHGFPLGEEVEDRPAALAVTVASLLHAAERHVCFSADCRCVDVGDAGFHVAYCLERIVDILRVDGR